MNASPEIMNLIKQKQEVDRMKDEMKSLDQMGNYDNESKFKFHCLLNSIKTHLIFKTGSFKVSVQF